MKLKSKIMMVALVMGVAGVGFGQVVQEPNCSPNNLFSKDKCAENAYYKAKTLICNIRDYSKGMGQACDYLKEHQDQAFPASNKQSF